MRASMVVSLLFGGFVVLLVAAAGAVVLSIRQDEVSTSIRATRDIDRQLMVIERAVADAETGQRGYLLTGRSEYLAPYDDARHALPADLIAMRSLLAPNPTAAAAFEQLAKLIEQKLDELQTTVALQSSGRAEDARAIVNSDAGRTLMESFRRVSDELSADVRAGLEERRAHLATLNALIRWALVVSVLLVVLVGGLGAIDLRRRIRAMAGANARLRAERDSREAAESQVRQLQRMDAIGQLTGGVAHDFNNMLAVIMGSLEMAARRLGSSDDEGASKAIANAEEGARRAAQLTSRLLAFARRQPLDPKVVDPTKLVASLSEMLRRTFDATIGIETVVAGGLWRICVDQPQLDSALLNLAVNARDAMPNGGKLTLEASNAELDERYAAGHSEVRAGQYVVLSVTDNGSGMSSDVIERAFEPFFSTKGAGKGTGLGLSQVFGFVKQSGGHVKIYSELDRGTTVKVYLPRYAGAAPDATAAAVVEVPPPSNFAGVVILLVEDDVAVAEVNTELLRHLGYDVVTCVSPIEALELLQHRTDIHLLFTDVVMPEMTGRQLADRALLLRPDLKVLYTSGYTRNAIVHNGVIDDGTMLLQKPFTLAQLAAKIEEALERFQASDRKVPVLPE